jgi:hypothetical protein
LKKSYYGGKGGILMMIKLYEYGGSEKIIMWIIGNPTKFFDGLSSNGELS